MKPDQSLLVMSRDPDGVWRWHPPRPTWFAFDEVKPDITLKASMYYANVIRDHSKNAFIWTDL